MVIALGWVSLRRVRRAIRRVGGLALVRLIRRRISRVVPMLLVRSTLWWINLVLGHRCLLRWHSGTSRLSWSRCHLVWRRLPCGRSRRRWLSRSTITSGRLLLIRRRRMGLIRRRLCRRLSRSGWALLLRRLLLWNLRSTSHGRCCLIRPCSLTGRASMRRITFMSCQRTTRTCTTVHRRATSVLQDVRRRKQRLDVVLRIGQIRQINQVPVQRHMIRHALVRLAHVLEVLNGLNQAGVFVQNLLNVHRTWRRRRPTSLHRPAGTSPIARVGRLLGLLLLRVRDRHVCFFPSLRKNVKWVDFSIDSGPTIAYFRWKPSEKSYPRHD